MKKTQNFMKGMGDKEINGIEWDAGGGRERGEEERRKMEVL